MAGYIGQILSSYTASSLLSGVYSPNWVSSSSALRSGFGNYASDFATIASDYKALQTKKYDTLSTSYSYLKEVTSTDYATEAQTSTEKAEKKAETEPERKPIEFSPGQMAQIYGRYGSKSRLLDILV